MKKNEGKKEGRKEKRTGKEREDREGAKKDGRKIKTMKINELSYSQESKSNKDAAAAGVMIGTRAASGWTEATESNSEGEKTIEKYNRGRKDQLSHSLLRLGPGLDYPTLPPCLRHFSTDTNTCFGN